MPIFSYEGHKAVVIHIIPVIIPVVKNIKDLLPIWSPIHPNNIASKGWKKTCV